MDKKWKVIALWVLPITIVILITWQILGSSTNTQVNQTNTSNPSRNAPVAKISYGRFLDYVKAGRVTSVDIYEGGRNAIVESVDPEIDNRIQRLRVDLPGLAPELVSSLKDEGISFDIHPPKTAPAGVGILGNLLFPIILIGGLIFFQEDQTQCQAVQGKQCNLVKQKQDLQWKLRLVSNSMM